jgi:hypothetical protein
MKILKTLVFTALFAATAMAQNQVLSGITWNIGLPSGRMSDFMDKASFGGFAIEGRRFLSEEFSVGGSFSWNYWSELTDQTIPLEHGAVGGTQIRYINSFPFLVNAHYYIGDRKDQIRPYLGLNVGAYYILQRLDIGVWSFQNDHWHFGLAPEAGFMIEMSRGTYFMATARYNYAFDSGSTMGGDSKNTYAYWGINLGVSWMSGWF